MYLINKASTDVSTNVGKLWKCCAHFTYEIIITVSKFAGGILLVLLLFVLMHAHNHTKVTKQVVHVVCNPYCLLVSLVSFSILQAKQN